MKAGTRQPKSLLEREPKDCEVYRLIIKDYNRIRFSRPLLLEKTTTTRKINPKRLPRIAHREVTAKGIGTKAQQALQMEYERNKKERRKLSEAEGRVGKSKI